MQRAWELSDALPAALPFAEVNAALQGAEGCRKNIQQTVRDMERPRQKDKPPESIYPLQRLTGEYIHRLHRLQEALGGAGSPPRPTRRRIGPDEKQEARDQWIYEQYCKGRTMPLAKIAAELKKIADSRGWTKISSIQGISQAARRYAQRHGKPAPPARQNL
jgi:hypothetical protein